MLMLVQIQNSDSNSPQIEKSDQNSPQIGELSAPGGLPNWEMSRTIDTRFWNYLRTPWCSCTLKRSE